MSERLSSFLNRVGMNFTQNWYQIRDIQEWMLAEIYRKRKSFPYFRKRTLFSYVSWQKTHSEEPLEFLYTKFDSLFRYFLQKVFTVFQENQLELVGIEGHSTGAKNAGKDLFFEYKYHLTSDEIHGFELFPQAFHHPDHYYHIITYMFNLIVMVFAKLIKDILKLKFNLQINMLCADIKQDKMDNQDGMYVHFLIGIRQMDRAFLRTYLYSLIYHFAEVLPNINQTLLHRLKLENDKIYPIAAAAYPFAEQSLATVFYTLERKAQIIGQITPMLDVFNYIASRVEDSLFQTEVLVKEIIHDKIISQKTAHHASGFLEIFNFLNGAASLFSTFQANNKADRGRQYQLLFMYLQYFNISSPEAFLYPEKVEEAIQNEQLLTMFPSISSKTFINFIFETIGLVFSADEAFDTMFQRLFNKSVFELNEKFFEVYLFSLNQKFFELLATIRGKTPDFNYTFGEIIHFMLEILQSLVVSIFIAESPEKAQKNFKDQRSRYTPDKITLRVLELRLFKDIPLSDNNWQDYYLSRNKSYVKKIFSKYLTIPDHYFFSPERLLKINMIYERRMVDPTPFLETWLIKAIIKRFYGFQARILDRLPVNYSKQELTHALYTDFSVGIIDTRILEKLEEYSEFFANLWEC